MATLALFSASKKTHYALVVYDSEWVTAALQAFLFLLIHRSGYKALFGCYMASATWNCTC